MWVRCFVWNFKGYFWKGARFELLALCEAKLPVTNGWFHHKWPIIPSFGVSLTHWGRVTHMCVGNLTIIGSGNGLSPGRRQAITWTNVGILFIGPLGTNFGEMLMEILTVSFKKIHLKMSSGKWRPFCLGLSVLKLAEPSCWKEK